MPAGLAGEQKSFMRPCRTQVGGRVVAGSTYLQCLAAIVSMRIQANEYFLGKEIMTD